MPITTIADFLGQWAGKIAPAAPGSAIAAIALFSRTGRDRLDSTKRPDFSLVASTPTAFFLTDALGVIVDYNDAGLALATSMNVALTGGSKMRSLLGHSTAADSAIYRAMRQATQDGSVTQTFTDIGKDDASDISVEITIQGNPRFFLWCLHPVPAALALPQTAACPADLEDAAIGYYSADENGNIVLMNRTMRSLAGLDPQSETPDFPTLSDLFGKDSAALLPAASDVGTSIERVMVLTPKNRTGFPVRIAQRISRSDQNESMTQTFVSKRRRDPVRGDCGDVRRLVRILDDAPVAVAVTDLDGIVVEANDRLATMSGGAARVGAEIALAVRLDDRHDVNERLTTVAAGGAPDRPLDIKLTGQAGKEHEAQFHAHRIDTDDGEMMLTYVMDVSAEKVIERQLAQADKMQSVGKLAGGIAHDVNNVLTAIRGHCDLLMLRHHEGDPDFDHLNQIRGQTERAATVISQLLAFSRRQTMRRQVTHLSEMLDDMRFMLNPLVTERITFRARHSRDLGLVRIDRSEFHRVIMNLVVNAGDAMPQGGSITVNTRNVEPHDVESFGYDPIPKSHFVMVEVADNGTGISKTDLGSIFEPFFTTKGTGKGTGLGLSTVYGIIKQMDGFIYCESEVGQGTTFRIFLPRYFGPVEIESEKTIDDSRSAPRDLSGTGRVLLVEDEESVRSFAVRALELRGYQVTQAASGQEALDIVKEDPNAIDLIVSDVVMPEMTGPEMMRAVRAIRPEMKFIFISGYAEDAFREEMIEGEEFYFLPKPFSLKDLAVKVKKAFQD